MSEISRLLSNRVKVTGPLSVSPGRYQYLALEEAEPNLGAPSNPPPPGQVYVLTSDINGFREWTLIDDGGQGIQGIQGIQGLQGIQGFGIQGIQGIQGEGVQGAQGIQGEFGIQGPQGVDGTSVRIIGSVPNVNVIGDPQATLNGAFPGAITGDGVLDEATNPSDLWVYNGTTWINVGPVSGPQGIQGPEGQQGIQGLFGPQGPQGIQGDLGIQGNIGPQGLQGPQGIQGVSRVT